MTKYSKWSDKEAELFKKAWYSATYSREDLVRIFKRTWAALNQKAIRMELPMRSIIEEEARVAAIEEALKEDHVI